MNFLSILIELLLLAISFMFGVLCIKNPFVVARIIALWFRFVSGSSFEHYKSSNNRLNDVFELMDKPSSYMKRYSRQIDIIRFTGYIAIFVSVVGSCIAFSSGFQ